VGALGLLPWDGPFRRQARSGIFEIAVDQVASSMPIDAGVWRTGCFVGAAVWLALLLLVAPRSGRARIASDDNRDLAISLWWTAWFALRSAFSCEVGDGCVASCRSALDILAGSRLHDSRVIA
jgi:hypothetical protein